MNYFSSLKQDLNTSIKGFQLKKEVKKARQKGDDIIHEEIRMVNEKQKKKQFSYQEREKIF